MHTFLGLVIASLAVAAHGTPTIQIAGARNATTGKYPYMVSVRVWNEHWCGGTIINNRTILTAAQCIYKKITDSVTVLAGTNLVNDTKNIYKSKKLIWHENYDPRTMNHDIGLIVLSTEITYTKLMQPALLAISDSAHAGQHCHLPGWRNLGLTGERKHNKLQELDMFVYDHERCKNVWRTRNVTVRPTQICSFKEDGKGACFSDKGNPLIADHAFGIQIGIVSFASCTGEAPVINTKIYSYRDWVKKHTSI